MDYIFYWYKNLSDAQKTLFALTVVSAGCLGLAFLKEMGWF